MRDRLAAGDSVFGVWIDSMRTPTIVRIAASAGADFVFIDMEHSSLSYETVGDMCEMARACGITPLVRPFTRDEGALARLLDIGAMGVMLPDVTSRESVLALRDAALYPPIGRRGSTARSTAQDYQDGSGAAVKSAVNEQLLLAIQIESLAGIERLDEILSEGIVGFIEVGRGDLSTDMGLPLQARHPEVLEKIDEIIAIAARHGVPCGTLCSSIEDSEDMLARGMRSIVYPNERNTLLNIYTETFSALRQLDPRR